MLFRSPAAITLAYALLAFAVVTAERAHPELSAMASAAASVVREDPAGSQAMLSIVAGSMMTIVAVVYSILMVALSLASMQYSPRILTTFMSDPVSQTSMGMFVGTFTYCLLVLRVVEGGSEPFVPSASVSLAIVLALVAVADAASALAPTKPMPDHRPLAAARLAGVALT